MIILPGKFAAPSPVEKIPAEELTTADLVLLGARREAVNRTRYDATYTVIDYPGGDVPFDRGACTDVVIRAFRHAGIDLQKLLKWLPGSLENFSHSRCVHALSKAGVVFFLKRDIMYFSRNLSREVTTCPS
ncbi:MAG: DUF1287 domain-containing protein [Dethiobacteria bacterium]